MRERSWGSEGDANFVRLDQRSPPLRLALPANDEYDSAYGVRERARKLHLVAKCRQIMAP